MELYNCSFTKQNYIMNCDFWHIFRAIIFYYTFILLSKVALPKVLFVLASEMKTVRVILISGQSFSLLFIEISLAYYKINYLEVLSSGLFYIHRVVQSPQFRDSFKEWDLILGQLSTSPLLTVYHYIIKGCLPVTFTHNVQLLRKNYKAYSKSKNTVWRDSASKRARLRRGKNIDIVRLTFKLTYYEEYTKGSNE